MPATSTLSGWAFSNWGPLTTTFTAPTSCPIVTGNVAIGESSLLPNFFYNVDCAPTYDWSCAPTGTITSLPKAYTALELNPEAGYEGHYFSPGLYCPSGWATVGIASRDGQKPVNSSGVVSPTMPVPTSVSAPLPNLAENAFMQLLEPSETAVWCCPRFGTPSTLPTKNRNEKGKKASMLRATRSGQWRTSISVQ